MVNKTNQKCVFCEIVAGEIPSKKLWENEEFQAIENKFKDAPVHVLVIPKAHIAKAEQLRSTDGDFYGRIMSAVFEVVRVLELEKKGFQLVYNGAGYNGIEHEHFHVLSGKKLLENT